MAIWTIDLLDDDARARAQAYIRARVAVTPDGCWLWTKGCLKGGYGAAWVDGAPILAHRLSWLALRGAIPSGAFVCHTCDTPACVQPAHLFLGDALTNARDRARKRWISPRFHFGSAPVTEAFPGVTSDGDAFSSVPTEG